MATKVEQLRHAAKAAEDAYSAEMLKYNDDNLPTPDAAAHIDELRKAMTSSALEAKAAETFAVERAALEARQSSRFESRDGDAPRAAQNDGAGAPGARGGGSALSLGQRFVENPTFKEWLAMVAPTGQVSDKARIQSPPLGFKGLSEFSRRADLITGLSSTSGGALVTNAVYPGVTELGRRPLGIRDVITNLQTESDVVEYVRITGETNSAAPVAEATAASGGSGVKPESGMTFERVSTNVKTIAHWIPATKRALSDASQLRGLIDAFLRYGLEEELEDQIVTGDGVGENFTGILETSGTQAQAYDTSLLKTTRIARRKVLTVGRRRPNAYILNPIDWESIDLLQDAENRYYFGGPMEMGTPRLWGLPVIESEAVTQGIGLVGDFSTCVLWDREDAAVSVSDSHSDFFIRNLVAILAELRAAFGILKPNAIVEIDLTA
jgi:HK97 family phage major capsid protein